jgi:hypothetical protein
MIPPFDMPVAKTQPPRSTSSVCRFRFLHASEQYYTRSQTFAHFFLQANGRLQTGQIFVGRLGFL